MKFTKVLFLITLLNIMPFVSHSAEVEIVEIKTIDTDQVMRDTLKISAGIAAIIIGYKLVTFAYDKVKGYAHNKVLDKCTNTIALVLTPNFNIEQLPQHDREKMLRKKAKFINVRKRLITKLKQLSDDIPANLSAEHRSILEKDVKHAEKIFKLIDAFRTTNPYEYEYVLPSAFDNTLENYMIKSIILSTKPLHECTQSELMQKKRNEEWTTELIKRLKGKISTAIMDQIMESSLFMNILLA